MGFYTNIKSLSEVPCFSIEKDQVFDSKNRPIEGIYSLRNTTQDTHLGMVTKRYRPIQMQEMFDVLDHTFKAAQIRPTGWVSGWGGQKIVIRSEIDCADYFNMGEDVFETYLYTIIDNSGKGSNRFIPSTIRTTCDNQLHAVIKAGAKFTLLHSNNFDEKVKFTAKSIERTLEQFKTFGKDIQLLKAAPFTQNEMFDLAKSLIKGKTHKAQCKQQLLVELFNYGQGNEGKTKYDALNAVTDYDTNHKVHRVTDIGHIRGLDGYTSIARKAYSRLAA